MTTIDRSPEPFALNKMIRAAQSKLDELNAMLERYPSASLANRIATQEKRVDALLAKHPRYQ